MVYKIKFKKVFIILLGLILSVHSMSYADSRDRRGDHRNYRYRDHPHYVGNHPNPAKNNHAGLMGKIS